MFKKMLSLLLAVMMVVSLAAVGVVNTGAAEVPVASTGDLDPETLYFDSSTTGWEFGERSKISFHIFGGDFGTEENSTTGLAWGTKKALGTAVADSNGVFSFKPSAKGLTLNEGVQYKIIFGFSKAGTGAIDGGQTYDLLFTTDCLGHIAYCDGTEYENPVDSSKKTLAAFWQDMDASVVGPVLQISSIGNVVGTCPEAGKTPQSIFNDFLTVVNSETGVTAYANALHFVVEPGTKTEQKMIDDIGADLGLAKQDIQAAFEAAEIETTWDYAVSTVHEHTPGEPVRENEVAATFTSEGSYDEVTYCSGCGEEISREHKTIEQRTPDPDTLYFDSSTTGWDMGTKGKISFHIFGGDLENGLAWGTKKALGTAVSGMDGMFSFKPSAKGLTLNEGVQYKIIFGFSKAGTGAIDGGQTYDLLFTTDCLGHIAYCDGTEYENPVDSSKKTLAAFWHDMDASEYGPVLQISSIGNVVGTCPEAGRTPESIFNDFLTVVDSVTEVTTYANALHFVVEPGTKTEQKMIDDIGTDLGLTKQQVFDAFYNNNIETAWDYTVSTLPGDVTPPHTHTPGDPVIENDHASTCTTAGAYDEVIYCTECHEELSRETKYHELAAHTPGEAVQENIVHATCTAAGSYDEVVYCTVCHAELSRTPRVIQKTNHSPGDPVIENDHASTCTVRGAYDEVTYCTVCQGELSRETKYHDLAPHTPGTAVHENEVVSHDKTTYDDVVYCTVCQAEISRTPVELPIITHTLTYVPEVPATEQATGTKAHYTCSGCTKLFADAAGTQEVTPASLIIPKLDHVHTPGQTVIENNHASTCTVRGSYDEVVYCTACQTELSRETKYHELAAHTPGTPVIENDHVSTCTVRGAYDEVTYCTVCQGELSRETKYHDLAPHTPGTAVHENEVVSHDKTTYDDVVYCTVCQAEISRTPVELPIITHTLTYVPEVPATEQATGTKAHYTCSGCTKLFADAAGTQEVTPASLIIPKLDHVHTPGQTVIENEVAATCKAAGSYDEVVYCTSCHAEISRTHKTIAKLAHTPGTTVIENEVAATCKAAGSYDEVVYCTVCHDELSRTHKTIAKLAHTPGTAVRENEVPATCTAAGSYDEVVYCTVCHDELSRTHKTIAKLAHTLTFKPYKAATEEADGWNAHYQCSECGKYFSDAEGKNELTWDQIVIPRIVIGKRGDVDGDGKITILDVTYIQRVLAGVKARDSVVEKLGDVDGDGSLTTVDTTLLQRWLLGLNQDLDIGEDV